MAGFPTKLTNSSIDLISKLAREGIYSGIELNGAGIAPTTGSLGINTYTNPPTECFFAQDAVISIAGGKATGQLLYMSGPNNSGTGTTSHRLALNNSTGTVGLNTIITAASPISFNLRDGDGTTTLLSSCNIGGTRMTADLNFNAEKVIMWIGDSITRGSVLGGNSFGDWTSMFTTPAVSPNDHFAFQVRNYFQNRGIDCRLILKAMGSYTARNMGYWVRNGWLDVEQVDCIFYQLGTNDATGTTTDQQFTDEINRIIDWRNRVYKKLPPIVFVGSTPLNNSTFETRLAQLRTIESNIVSSSSTNLKLYYLSLASAFDRTILTNYTSSDGTHPNITNNIAVANTITTWINTNNFTF